MNRIIKQTESRILKEKIRYGDKRLLQILVEEQNYICAYSQVKITGVFSVDTDHFNPTVKGTSEDNYENWFAVSTKVNRQKGSSPKWNKFQPILHPTALNFEERILYKNGAYENNEHDLEAQHLIEYLNLNQEQLYSQRLRYIQHLRLILNSSICDGDTNKLKQLMAEENSELIQFTRAISSEFGIYFN